MTTTRWSENRSMRGANKLMAAAIIVDRHSFMGTGPFTGHKIAIRETDKQAAMSIGGITKAYCAVSSLACVTNDGTLMGRLCRFWRWFRSRFGCRLRRCLRLWGRGQFSCRSRCWRRLRCWELNFARRRRQVWPIFIGLALLQQVRFRFFARQRRFHRRR